ncbi:MAG: replication initiator protein WhiP [Desulfurococcales archaeon]|nr:replication initiator protein WhiP [Desulfurococcales archaeon]
MGMDPWELIGKLEERKRGEADRSGPRSKLVDAIFVLLLSRPMRASEIAGVLGYEPKYVSSYLSYWKSRGFVEYEAGLWYLTSQGEEYAREVVARETDEAFNRFVALAKKIASESLKPTRKDKNEGSQPRRESGFLSFIVDQKNLINNKIQDRSSKAACATSILQRVLDEEEMEVAGALLKHYTRWGTTYTYVDQLAEEMRADTGWLMKILRLLQSKGIVYIYTDPRLGLRVGLTRKVKEILESC